MEAKSPAVPRSVWLGLSLMLGLICLILLQQRLVPSRPQISALPVLSRVADFTLTNQDGVVMTLADLTNHVWIADIIFTRCGGPCPRLTAQMKSLTEKIPAAVNCKFITLTTDPEFDTPEVLKKYGSRGNVDFTRWSFLTGDKTQIGLLAANSLKLSTQQVKPDEQKNAADLFIHATLFVVVDKRAQMRAYFETGGEGVDWTNDIMPKIISTVRELEAEP